MKVEVSPRVATLVPGRPCVFTVQVFNNEPLISGHSLRVLGVDSRWVRLDKESLSLFPGTSGIAVLSVTLPAGSPAGLRRVSIEVKELTDPRSSEVVDLDLEILAQRALVLKLDPASVSSGRSASVVALVTNTGNITEAVRLEGTDDEGKVGFSFLPPELNLAPGEARAVDVELRAPRPWVGSPKVRPLTLEAAGQGVAGPRAAAFGTLVQRPWLSRGYLALVGLLAAATVFAGVLTATLSQLNATAVNDSNAVMQSLEASTNAQAAAMGGSGPGSLSGSVSLVDGQAAGPVAVDLFSAGDLSTPLASTSTSKGEYRFAGLGPGAYKLEFQGAGLATLWYPDSPSPGDASSIALSARQALSDLDVTLAGLPAMVSGNVDGPSPGGATVTLEDTGRALASDPAVVNSTTTGAAGNFSLSGLPTPAVYRLVVAKPGFAPAFLRVQLASGEDDTGVTVFLEPGDGSISGKVSSFSGPLGGATVNATVPTEAGQVSVSTVTLTTSGKTGTFALRDLPTPAQLTLKVSAPGYAAAVLSVSLHKGQQLRGEQISLTPSIGAISGRVSLVSGGPAGGVSVSVTDGQFSISTTTASIGLKSGRAQGVLPPSLCTGCYVLSGLPVPGTYQVTFARPGLLSLTRQVRLEAPGPAPTRRQLAASTARLDVSLQAATAAVYGRVTTGAGRGEGGVSVLLTSGGATYQVTSADLPVVGEYELDDVAPGSYTISFGLPGASVVSSVLSLGAGERLHYNAVVSEPVTPVVRAPTTTTLPKATSTTSTSEPAPTTTGPVAHTTTTRTTEPLVTTTAGNSSPATTVAHVTTTALPAPTPTTTTSLPTTTSSATTTQVPLTSPATSSQAPSTTSLPAPVVSAPPAVIATTSTTAATTSTTAATTSTTAATTSTTAPAVTTTAPAVASG